MQFWLIHKLEWDTTLAEKATVEESEEKEEARASFRCEALLFKKTMQSLQEIPSSVYGPVSHEFKVIRKKEICGKCPKHFSVT